MGTWGNTKTIHALNRGFAVKGSPVHFMRSFDYSNFHGKVTPFSMFQDTPQGPK